MEIPLLMCMAQKLCQQRTAFKPFSLNTVCLVVVFSFLNIIIDSNTKQLLFTNENVVSKMVKQWFLN